MSDLLPRFTAAMADRYEIQRELGSGGMATVFLARDHGTGVVHRDVKPENILLESGHAVVADFGIWLHSDPDLESLRDYAPFWELLRPKG